MVLEMIADKNVNLADSFLVWFNQIWIRGTKPNQIANPGIGGYDIPTKIPEIIANWIGGISNIFKYINFYLNIIVKI